MSHDEAHYLAGIRRIRRQHRSDYKLDQARPTVDRAGGGRARRVARGFTRQNVMEIALMQRLLDAGMSPSAAAEKLARLFARLKQKSPEGFVTFFQSGDFIVSLRTAWRAVDQRHRGARDQPRANH